jgi:hypothetical protein
VLTRAFAGTAVRRARQLQIVGGESLVSVVASVEV